jgi:hypothetical protein
LRSHGVAVCIVGTFVFLALLSVRPDVERPMENQVA